MDTERSYEKIERSDLERLSALAREDREVFFSRIPRWKELYSDRVICMAMCQGAALHYVNSKNGIKDFDVWTFYAQHPKASFPARRVVSKDFGMSKFGKDSNEAHYIGRRVDLIGRSIACAVDVDPVEAIKKYLSGAQTSSARLLAVKAVVLIEPADRCGLVVWDGEYLTNADLRLVSSL